MTHTIVRIRLSDEAFRKYKVFCAIQNISMTQMTEKILNEYIKKENEKIKIIKVEK